MEKPRDRILEATIRLLRDSKDIAPLTIRAIAKKAKVGVGLVNYHFKDKDSLMREAVRAFVGREIVKGYGDRGFRGTGLVERVELLLRGPMDFLAEYPVLSRVSVLFDLSSPVVGDNCDDSFRELAKEALAIIPEEARPPDLGSRLWAVLGAIHEAFLRPELFVARTGWDYFKPGDRAAYAGLLARLLLAEAAPPRA